jgi:hypothetical protein
MGKFKVLAVAVWAENRMLNRLSGQRYASERAD